MSKASNPFTLSGNSPPTYTDKKIFDKIQFFESALSNVPNENNSALSIITLQSKWDTNRTLTPHLNVNYYSGSELAYENLNNESNTEDAQNSLKHVPNTQSDINESRPILVEVKALANLYKLNVGVLYNLIKSEPNFPYINVGLKKKYMIDLAKFYTWLNERTEQQKHDRLGIPTTVDLMKAFSNKKHGVKK